MRDPRDVAVSYYHFHRRDSGPNHPAGDDMESFVGDMVAGNIGYGSWGEHVGGWVGARTGSENFLLVRYEDMQANTKTELERLALFVGLDTRDSEIGFAVRETSFERLQAAERTQKQREDHGASEQRSHGGMFRQ